MPQIIPALLIAAGASVWVVQLATFAITIASAIYERRQAKRKAENARNEFLAGIKDIQSTVRSATMPTAILFGRPGKTGGALGCWFTTGNLKQYHHYTIIHAAHVCDGNDGYYLNNDKLLLNLSGEVIAPSKYLKQSTITRSELVNFENGYGEVLLEINSIVSISQPGFVDNGNTSAPGFNFAQGAINTTIQRRIDSAATGSWTVTYTYISSRPLLRLRFYNGEQASLDADLVAASEGTYKSSDAGRELCYTAVYWEADYDVFGQIGVPQITCLPRGVRTYDPRTGINSFENDNPALCARYYATAALGMRIPAAEIPDADIIEAANICDEFVTVNTAGFTQKRYTCNGALGTETGQRANLDAIVDSMLGGWVYSQGKLRIRCGAYRNPALPITADDILEIKDVRGFTPRREIYNSVEGTFVDPAREFAVVAFTPLSYPAYEAQDGGQKIKRPAPLNLPLTNNNIAAQRIAKAELERTRQGAACTLVCKMTVYDALPGDTVTVTVARYGWAAKVFEVLGRDQDEATVTYQLRETAPQIWAWNFGQAFTYDITPNTTLPNPFEVPAVAITSILSADAELLRVGGSVISRMRVVWAPVLNQYVTNGGRIELQFRKYNETEWTNAAPADGSATEQFIDQVSDRSLYVVQIRAMNSAGQRGDWTSATHVVVGKTTPPVNVQNLQITMTNAGALVSWSSDPAADASYTQLKKGAAWASGLPLGPADSQIERDTTTYPLGWLIAGTLNVSAKHFDTTGNASLVATVASINVRAPLAVQLTRADTQSNTLNIAWANSRSDQPIEGYYYTKELIVNGAPQGAVPWGSAGADSRSDILVFTEEAITRVGIFARDVAGNVSPATFIEATIKLPNDFKLLTSVNSAFAGAKINALIALPGKLSMLVNTTETWGNHFSLRGWTSSADKVAAGFPVHAQPGTLSASYIESFDIGRVVPLGTINATMPYDVIAGAPATTTALLRLGYSLNNIDWTDGAIGVASLAATNFRYWRVQILASATQGLGLLQVNSLQANVSIQKRSESTAVINCLASDALGTLYNCVEPFSDVSGCKFGVVDTGVAVAMSYTIDDAASPGVPAKIYIFARNPVTNARINAQASLFIEGL